MGPGLQLFGARYSNFLQFQTCNVRVLLQLSLAEIRRQITPVFYRHRQFHLPRRVRRSRRGSLLHLRPARHVEFRRRPPAVFRSEPTHAGKIQVGDGRRSADGILRFAFENVLARDTRRQSMFSKSQRRSVNLREKATSATNSTSTF